MLTNWVVIVLLLSVDFTKADGTLDEAFSQDVTPGSGVEVDQIIEPCCVIGDRFFNSLGSAIRSFTNNAIIKIVGSNTALDTNISLENLENVSIIGHKTPTVNCNGIGAIRFSYCNNVTIKDVNWENCGSSNESSYPGLSFYKSSNVTIQNCVFYSSMGQALLFSKTPGNVFINNCEFTHNNYHRGHGAAVQYTTDATTPTITRLVIDGCYFSNNGAARSIVYIDGLGKTTEMLNSYLQNSVFIGNEGVPIYLSHYKLHITGDVLFRQNTGMHMSGGGIFSSSSVVMFKNKSDVTFYNNSAIRYGGAILLNDSTVYFGEYSVIKFLNNFAESFGGALCSMNKSAMVFGGNAMVTFQSNKANTNGGALYIDNGNALFDENSIVMFSGNTAEFGGAIFSVNNSNLMFVGNTTVTFNNNKASLRGGGIHSHTKSNITFDSHSTVTLYDNSAKYGGGAMLSGDYSSLLLKGNTTVTYEGNKAAESGGAIESYDNSSITFEGNSKVKYSDNQAQFGGAIFSDSYSEISFNGNTTVTYSNNKAGQNAEGIQSHGGAVYSVEYSIILFDQNSKVKYEGNYASKNGGAVSSAHNCIITFDGNSTVAFNENRARDGGAVSSDQYSVLSFNGNATVTYNGNKVSSGGGAIVSHTGNITFDKHSNVVFCNNTAAFGGAVLLTDHSNLTFNGNTEVTYKGNKAGEIGGAIYSEGKCNITFDKHSTVIFDHNSATNGGVVFSARYSNLSFNGNTTVVYKSNNAGEAGGAVTSEHNCSIKFDGNSTVTFNANEAKYGGAVYSRVYSIILFIGHSTVTYNNNKASTIGGAIYSHVKSLITFDKHSTVMFYDNSAAYGGVVNSIDHSSIHASTIGGAISSYDSSIITFNGNSTVTFGDNRAQNGGAIYSLHYSNILFDGNTTVRYNHNTAGFNGGAINSYENCMVVIEGNSTVTFYDNRAVTVGGAMSSTRLSNVIFQGNAKVDFTNNKARDGGAINIEQSKMNLVMSSQVQFNYNSASRSGGSIYLVNNYMMTFESDSNVTFHQNNAAVHGGAIYGELIQTNMGKISSNNRSVDFSANTALIGENVYIQIEASCDETCLNTSIVGLNVTHNYPPRHLALYKPATCVNKNTTNDCDTYFINNIMLGQNIKINACVLSFHDRHAGSENFVVSGENEHQSLGGTQFVPIACDFFEGIIVRGKKISDKTNFTMTITSYRNSDIEIFVRLIAELSPCHSGFHYDSADEKCVCYDDSDIVSCSGSTSTIKRGYWFGIVEGKTTVATCPNNYCDFTCCETTNGFYRLSPMRLNQCSSHRSGTACGSCEEGYTLSYDSAKCVSVDDKCTTGQTVLVIVLSVIYWIVLVVVVFVVTYYHVEIGYFYVITYYYSMLDVLLDQHLYVSQGLFTVVSIMSSTAKVTPQFLGQLCLVKEMSGIDQQFIHYVHPLAVTIIVGMICLSARMSYRFSAFVSRGVIRVICFLLLLSYTSVATTSLLLLRSLTFDNVNKVYTYLSPDIEYFHGRHLPYGIIAILCTLVIVIGLPLLLLLEPFINHKINFYRIKPLLDQFQGCYRDKYRSFAAYYMICRVVIISIIIITSSNKNITHILLLIISTILLLIQLIVKPYKSKILNIFDGAILHMMIFTSLKSLFDDFGTGVLLAVIILFVVLPLIAFAVMELILYRENIKKIFMHCKTKPVISIDNTEVPSISGDIGLVIDNNMRKNAIIVDM